MSGTKSGKGSGKGVSSLPRQTHLRPNARNKQALKLRKLRCFEEVHEKICLGWPASKVAEFIQDEQQEYTDIERTSLISTITLYRKSLPPAEKAKYTLPKDTQRAIEELPSEIDELREFIALFKLQKDRIDIDASIEKNVGKLLPTMNQEMRVASEILKSIATLKMDLGITNRQLGTVNVDADAVAAGLSDKYSKDVSSVVSDPIKRKKFLSIAQQAISISKRNLDELDEESSDDVEGEIILEDPTETRQYD